MSGITQDCPDFSIIIPAYNEAHRIPSFLTRMDAYLQTRRFSYEVLIVDDGSRDATSAVVAQACRRLPRQRLIRCPVNMGKGAAVRRGMQEARGRLQLFADADGATGIEELSGLEEAILQGADIAIGSRALAARDGRYRVHARWHRSVLGAVFNATVQRLGLEGIADTQCGFKLFRRPVAQDLFAVSTVNGYGFDLELLYIAKRRGYRIAEIPVNWTDQPGSKVRPLRDGWFMLRELRAVRRRESLGLYVVSSKKPSAAQSLTENPINVDRDFILQEQNAR